MTTTVIIIIYRAYNIIILLGNAAKWPTPRNTIDIFIDRNITVVCVGLNETDRQTERHYNRTRRRIYSKSNTNT